MKIMIYGAGAVGLGITGCIVRAGAKPIIVARADAAYALRRDGLISTGLFGAHTAKRGSFSVHTSLAQLPAGPYDYILVCTKAYDLRQAAQALSACPSLTDRRTQIILLQNGWGIADEFLPTFAREQIYNARVLTGFCRQARNHVEITAHVDALHVGSLFHNDLARISPLCQLIAEGGLPCQAVTHIAKDIWAKLLLNCALNPLGAILDVPCGPLGRSPYARELMNEIIREIFQVMQHAGYTTHWSCAADYIALFHDTLLPRTAKHEASTLQDLRARRRTEIAWLNGAIVKLGQQYQIPVPHNTNVYNMVKFLEARFLSEPEGGLAA
jgi:2-dehydropantoate 2-reductase